MRKITSDQHFNIQANGEWYTLDYTGVDCRYFFYEFRYQHQTTTLGTVFVDSLNKKASLQLPSTDIRLDYDKITNVSFLQMTEYIVPIINNPPPPKRKRTIDRVHNACKKAVEGALVGWNDKVGEN